MSETPRDTSSNTTDTSTDTSSETGTDRGRTDGRNDRDGRDSRDGRNDRNGRDDHDGRDVLDTDTMQWVSAIVALVGLWIIASPFVFEATDTATWNNTLVGTGIFALAGYNFMRMAGDRLALVGVAALVILLGVWIAATPRIIEMGSDDLALSTTISGIIVAGLSAYNAYANSKADTPEHSQART